MQNDIILKDFEFDERLIKNVTLFDEVLNKFNEPVLFENQNFSVVADFEVFPNYLVMENTDKVNNSLPLTIWFEADGLRIDIDGISETFEWSNKQIDESQDKVTELIRNLFTGYVLIETRGSSKFVEVFDESGFFVDAFSHNNWLHFFTGLYLFRYKNYRRLYPPMFSITK